MKSIEERLLKMEEEAAIRNLAARFADACMVADFETFKILWAPGGQWTIHEPFLMTAEGIESIDNMVRTLRKGRGFFVQFVHSGVISINGDTATVRWIMQEASKGPEEHYYHNYAVYMDNIVKTDGEWRFLSRDYHYMWLNTEAFPGNVFALPTEVAAPIT